MAVSFSNDPAAKGFFAPTRFEADIFDCEVEGAIPRDLDGAFYRVGWDWLYPPKLPDDAGPFSGDGYVGMFRFQNGSVDYRGRYVRTERYKADRKARRQLFGNYRNRNTDDPSVRSLDRTVANTALVTHAGKLFALKEDALPIELDPNTLETRGPWDFGGRYASRTFTAHPKIDPLTGEMICYGYEATGDLSDDVFACVIDRNGTVTREWRFKAPIVSLMHDIGLTAIRSRSFRRPMAGGGIRQRPAQRCDAGPSISARRRTRGTKRSCSRRLSAAGYRAWTNGSGRCRTAMDTWDTPIRNVR